MTTSYFCVELTFLTTGMPIVVQTVLDEESLRLFEERYETGLLTGEHGSFSSEPDGNLPFMLHYGPSIAVIHAQHDRHWRTKRETRPIDVNLVYGTADGVPQTCITVRMTVAQLRDLVTTRTTSELLPEAFKVEADRESEKMVITVAETLLLIAMAEQKPYQPNLDGRVGREF